MYDKQLALQRPFLLVQFLCLILLCNTADVRDATCSNENVPKVILDTDPSSDPDDVGCMAMLHSMASRGECEILAVVNSIHHKEGSLTISAINQFYNRSSIPVGDYKAYPKHDDAPADLYSHMVSRQYPRSLKKHSDAIDSVSLYREVLATAQPKSITIVVIGTMHNFSALLKSEGCKFSSLNGVELVREKVEKVVTMGGNFIDGSGLDRTNWGGSTALCSYTSWSCLNKERNAMCRFVVENCPAVFVASGWEVGCGDYHNAKRGNVMTGQALKGLEKDHIVRRSYEYHFAHRGGDERIDRHSNDQCALLYALRGEGENFKATLGGDIELTKEGECKWTKSEQGRQGYISKRRSKELIASEIEELMMGDRIALDNSAPDSPTELKSDSIGNAVRISWMSANDSTQGSWVVAYRVYQNGILVGSAFGTQFFMNDEKGDSKIEVRAVNASGTESKGASIVISGAR